MIGWLAATPPPPLRVQWFKVSSQKQPGGLGTRSWWITATTWRTVTVCFTRSVRHKSSERSCHQWLLRHRRHGLSAVNASTSRFLSPFAL